MNSKDKWDIRRKGGGYRERRTKREKGTEEQRKYERSFGYNTEEEEKRYIRRNTVKS